MKKVLILIACFGFYSKGIGQTISELDSLNYHKQDSIYTNRSSYVGQPLSKIFNDLGFAVVFSLPDNMGTRLTGTRYYKKFLLFFPWITGAHHMGLNVEIANRVYVNVNGIREKMSTGIWNLEMKDALKSSIIVDIKKFK